MLSHLHDNGVVYVDLKPENVLVQDCGHIMLCDMDLVHTLQEIQQIQQLDAGAHLEQRAVAAAAVQVGWLLYYCSSL